MSAAADALPAIGNTHPPPCWCGSVCVLCRLREKLEAEHPRRTVDDAFMLTHLCSATNLLSFAEATTVYFTYISTVVRPRISTRVFLAD